MLKHVKTLILAVFCALRLSAASDASPVARLIFSGPLVESFWRRSLPTLHAVRYEMTVKDLPKTLCSVPETDRRRWVKNFCFLENLKGNDTRGIFTEDQFFCLCYALANLEDNNFVDQSLVAYGFQLAQFCENFENIRSFFALEAAVPGPSVLHKVWPREVLGNARRALRLLLIHILGSDIRFLACGCLFAKSNGVLYVTFEADFQVGRISPTYRVMIDFSQQQDMQVICFKKELLEATFQEDPYLQELIENRLK